MPTRTRLKNTKLSSLRRKLNSHDYDSLVGALVRKSTIPLLIIFMIGFYGNVLFNATQVHWLAVGLLTVGLVAVYLASFCVLVLAVGALVAWVYNKKVSR